VFFSYNHQEAGTFSDLQQQVDAQTQQLSAIAAARTNAHAALQTEAADGVAGGDRARKVLGDLTAVEAWSFEVTPLVARAWFRGSVQRKHWRALHFTCCFSFSSLCTH
jgi:hypothetical protein